MTLTEIDAMFAAANEERLERLEAAMKSQANRDPKAYIDPLNPYTGEVSVLAIMRNLENGHTGFPEGLGNTRQLVPADFCRLTVGT